MDKKTTAHPAPTTTSHAVYGAPCWVSLMTRDLEDAQEFYSAVLGWKFRSARLGDEFSIALQDGRPVAGIGALAQALQVAVAWTPYFAVSNADEAAARIRERSGTIAVGPMTFSAGRGALAADRDGAVFGIWEGELFAGWGTWQDEVPAWLRLRTRDAFEAAIFYGQVLEWSGGKPGCCETDYQDEEVLLRCGGHILARLSSGALEAASDPTIRPRWQVIFTVPDVDEAAKVAVKLGGTIMEEQKTNLGEEITLRDPEGGLFTIAPRSADGGHGALRK
ncbi:VOC family protein [Streptomyces sp. NPDC002896]|uniref:VOC family protein n=1 Tax=Streptomyces sp. NPDC002896 TaxID=3154438 RepID=UPI00332310B5